MSWEMSINCLSVSPPWADVLPNIEIGFTAPSLLYLKHYHISTQNFFKNGILLIFTQEQNLNLTIFIGFGQSKSVLFTDGFLRSFGRSAKRAFSKECFFFFLRNFNKLLFELESRDHFDSLYSVYFLKMIENNIYA
ncbi:hypothetical protein BpHYR1_034556 [Brachionus plicatilis]|uniref:Uncharacterized protein n=1 Tax=Brachionus plicatilis TaxID=10195 RepID=A0A3M7R0L3_BRAPC|nr:hypothetical protein BpHYR1_034556 [Brachionus plicatilis]